MLKFILMAFESIDLVQFYWINALGTPKKEDTESVFCSFCTRSR